MKAITSHASRRKSAPASTGRFPGSNKKTVYHKRRCGTKPDITIAQVDLQKTDEHHLKQVSRAGDNSSYNKKIVSEKKHQAWHILFGNERPVEIAAEASKWIDPEWILLAVKVKKMSFGKANGAICKIFYPQFT